MSLTHSSRRALVSSALLALLAACGAPDQGGEPAPPVDSSALAQAVDVRPQVDPGGWAGQPTSLASSLAAMEDVFDADEAMKLLSAIDPYYRVRGNEGYLKSLERVNVLLRSAGFASGGADAGARDTVEFRDFGPVKPAWTPRHARLELITPEAGVLHEFIDEAGLERTFLCVNSFATRPEGVVAPVARYDASKPAEVYAGTVVYGSQPAEVLFRRAVQQGGALGVISSYLPDYNRPDLNRDSIRYSTIPYDAERHGFGLNVSRDSAEQLEQALQQGLVYVKVTIGARFSEARGRTLLAGIGGTNPTAGTVAVVGHLDEPGANDNGSGIATMAAMATGYLRAIRDGRLARPGRSITFIFGTEFECSGEWIKTRMGNVDMALVIDMVGMDQEKTGALALAERMPDPGAIWDRLPLDQHTMWGRPDQLRQSDLNGSFLNDYVLAAMRIRAQQTDWNVRDNPFEGGSDHEPFLERGVPALLLWHFTDQFYHTSLDRLDKVDPASMQHMAIVALGVVDHFANAGHERAFEVLDIVMEAARRRLTTEHANARTRLSAPAVAADPEQIDLVSRRERAIIDAWARWYREALLSVEDVEPAHSVEDGEHMALVEAIDGALAELRGIEREILDSL
jgi:hypothetical protein